MAWRSRSEVRTWAAAVASVVLMLGTAPATSPVASAQPTGVASEGGGAADPEVAIVMDASSSMLEPDEGGTRLDVAKRASLDLVDSLPDTARVGMLAYGTQVDDAPENHAPGCEDIRTLAPVGAVDKDRLRGEIDGLEARGYTPIGNALRAAADDLSADAAERSIVLVSDGIDTCAPPPACEVAEELADEGIGLAVHTVGFRADEATRAELECLSDVTGGTYRQADDAHSLTDSLQFLAQRAIVGYETTGTDFEFTDTPDEALYVGRGLYRTTLTTSAGVSLGETPQRYVRLAVPEGHRAWVSLTPLPGIDLGESGGGQGVNARLSAENTSSADCASTTDISQTSGGGFEPPESAVISVGGQETGGECDGSRWVVAAQVLTGSRGHVEDIELEMSVQFEPLPGDESDTWAAGDHGGAADPAPVDTSAPQPVVGGNSFNNAAEITEGAFTDAIVPGEFRYYRLPAEWGQRPVVTVRTGLSVREAADTLYADIYGPVRHEIADGYESFYEDPGELTIAADRPIIFRNRDANAGGASVAIAGEHYVAVSMNVTGSGALGVEQQFEIGVRLDGQPSEGPEWVPVNEPGPMPSDTPPDGDSAGSPAPESDDDTEQVAVDEDAPGWSGVWLMGGGVLLLVAAAAGLWALARRSGRDHG